MDHSSTGIVFADSILPEGAQRWSSFGIGFILECATISILVVLPMLMPRKLEAVRNYLVVPLDTPRVEVWKPPVVPAVLARRQPVAREISKVAEVLVLKSKVYAPVMTIPVGKIVVVKKAPVPETPLLAKIISDPTPPLSMGSLAIPNLKKPREEVETGGFGDPDGLKISGQINKNSTVAMTGSYDLPASAGQGNGSGGTNGARGVVATSGFGNGAAMGVSVANPRGIVRQGGFADEHSLVASSKVRQTSALSNSRPVEVLSKPKPQYTDEARANKIEGEVLLQVVFLASGEVKVERVVQGLGYGLDNSAQAAARQISFRPAERQGQPVDANAIVHITFALAY